MNPLPSLWPYGVVRGEGISIMGREINTNPVGVEKSDFYVVEVGND